MTEKEALTGPDFEVGIAAIDLPESTPVLGHARGEAVVLVRTGEEVRAVGRRVRTMAGRLAKGWWSGIRFVARGTTHVLTCAPVMRSARRH